MKNLKQTRPTNEESQLQHQERHGLDNLFLDLHYLGNWAPGNSDERGDGIMSIDDKDPLNVKICLHCKSIWIHRIGMNYCGDCGYSSFERTHDDNYKVAKNYPKIKPEFEVLRNPHFPLACNGWWMESQALSKLESIGLSLGYGRMQQFVDGMYLIACDKEIEL